MCFNKGETIIWENNAPVVAMFNMSDIVLKRLVTAEVLRVNACTPEAEALVEYGPQQRVSAAWVGR